MLHNFTEIVRAVVRKQREPLHATALLLFPIFYLYLRDAGKMLDIMCNQCAIPAFSIFSLM